MLLIKQIKYNRENAVEYAKNWAYKRNPKYYNFDLLGGDCTSFVSQSIYAGSKVMNYTRYGWYYKNGYNKSASWSGVEFLYNFLTTNKSLGVYGNESNFDLVEKGDIIQLSFDGNVFEHSLIIVDTITNSRYKDIYVAAHTDDCYYRDLKTYTYKKARFIKIDGVRSF